MVELSVDGLCSLTVTSWKDLGDGTDKTAEPWVRHEQAYDGSDYWGYKPMPKHRGRISEAFETPAWADRTLHLSVPPFEIFNCHFRFDGLYD